MRNVCTILWLANWIACCFRFTPFALIAIAFVFASCSATPKRSKSPAYSAPSSAKIQTAIATAQTSIEKAVAVHAKAATEKVIQLEALTAATPELHDLATAAHDEIDAFTRELTTAQTSLAVAETARAELQVRVETQTEQLNTANTQKNEALGLLEIEKGKADRASKQRNRLALLTLALLVWIFRVPLLKLGGSLFKMARLACGIPV